jgi:hypothetical protein
LLPVALKEWGTPFHVPDQIESYMRNPLGMWRGLLREIAPPLAESDYRDRDREWAIQ